MGRGLPVGKAAPVIRSLKDLIQFRVGCNVVFSMPAGLGRDQKSIINDQKSIINDQKSVIKKWAELQPRPLVMRGNSQRCIETLKR
jgi:hypothetical protein